MFGRIAAILMSILVLAASVRADTNIDLSLEPSSGTVNDVFALDVNVSGDEARALEGPFFDESAEFRIDPAGTSSSLSIVNGLQQFTLTYSFRLYADPNLPLGKHPIPKGRFRYGRETVLLKRPEIEILAPSDRRASSRKDGVDFVQIVDNPTPYVGEQITYKAEIASALGIAEVELEDLDFNGFRKETFGKKRELVRNIAGTRTRVHSVRDSLFPNAPGKISIPRRAITVKARAPVRRQNRGSWDLFDDVLSDFMSQGEIVERRLSADQIDVDVRPLPPAPPGISGYVPVGDIQIRWTLDKREIQFGESFTLEVTLRGDGDLRPVELPDLSTRAEVKIYPDKAEMQTEVEGDKIVFVKRFRTAIVPRRSGELELPEMVIPTFNPSKGEYRLLRVPPQHLNVVGKGGVDEQEPITAPRVSAPIEPQLAAADDLLPQHVGNEILESETEIPSWLVFLVLIGFPIAMIAMALLRRHAEQVRAEPERVAQRLALKKALQDLQQFKGSSAGDLDAFDVVLRRFLSERLRLRADSATRRELEDLLSDKLRSRSLIDRVLETFSFLERAKYKSVASSRDASLQDLVAKTEAVMREIDREARRG